MPYIGESDRRHIQPVIEKLLERIPDMYVGEINYVITKILLAMNPTNYSDYNEIMGLLESVKLEFFRRAMAVREDKKMNANGDVF